MTPERLLSCGRVGITPGWSPGVEYFILKNCDPEIKGEQIAALLLTFKVVVTVSEAKTTNL